MDIRKFGILSLIVTLYGLSFGAITEAQAAVPSTGFGARKEETTNSSTQTAPRTQHAQAEIPSEPPVVENVEWLKVPYEKAENEVLALFQRDVSKLEELADSVAVYDVRTTGQLPSDYHRNFKSKLERVLLTSQKIKIKNCIGCDESRLVRSENGEIRYEAISTESGRAAKIAGQIGAGHLLLGELNYTPEDLRLRVRLIDATTGDLRWTKEYSTADVVKTRESINDSGKDELGHGDSLGRVIIGEIAFITVLSPGISMLPTIDKGSGSQMVALPSFDFLLGERFDRGRKAFGFQFGGVANTGMGASKGTPLPWAVKIAPQFRYYFNPYNISSARISLNTELGALISSGLATGYAGIGPEIAMINRFSVSLMPIYILSANVSDTQILNETANGNFQNSSSDAGKFGGLGFIMKASINW